MITKFDKKRYEIVVDNFAVGGGLLPYKLLKYSLKKGVFMFNKTIHFTEKPKPEGVRGGNVPLPASPPAVGQGTASFSAEGSSDEDFFEAEQDDDYPF